MILFINVSSESAHIICVDGFKKTSWVKKYSENRVKSKVDRTFFKGQSKDNRNSYMDNYMRTKSQVKRVKCLRCFSIELVVLVLHCVRGEGFRRNFSLDLFILRVFFASRHPCIKTRALMMIINDGQTIYHLRLPVTATMVPYLHPFSFFIIFSILTLALVEFWLLVFLYL